MIRTINKGCFFKSVDKAKHHFLSPPPPLRRELLSYIPRIALAASAAYLVLTPSKKYADDHSGHARAYQGSAFITGFLLNIYAINYLIIKLSRIENNKKMMLTSSFILGVLSSLPIFFIQLFEGNGRYSSELIGIATMVTLGCIPLQILSFIEFQETVIPYINQYCMSLTADGYAPIHSSELIHQDAKALSKIFENLIRQNNIPQDFLLNDSKQFFLQHTDFSYTAQPAKFTLKKGALGLGGSIGVLLVECLNISYAKASYEVMATKMPSILSAILTTGVIFPMFVLAIVFGFNITYDFIETTLNLSHKVVDAIRVHSQNPILKQPYDAHPCMSVLLFALFGVLVSQSYAAVVQFNNDTMDEVLSQQSLAILNQLTILGNMLYNFYPICNLSHDFLCHFYAKIGDDIVKNKVNFYRFGQVVCEKYEESYEESIRTDDYMVLN
ncbi:MAG: hypothetical protein Q8R24_01220 [Legionellaceae bacterium]|nr:hypothetical protein [Legionellaceae bacterium]